ncbi:hAT transposon superfamily protein [Striga hermonthica]|uniref:HAT transposon superfamily protein n=1 Tax=Striga hermonthica TaxID=68872 RepID=A0A9N7R3K8_STRHE|nr:hAT transposon superfamily protein [Striga hermonthica]
MAARSSFTFVKALQRFETKKTKGGEKSAKPVVPSARADDGSGSGVKKAVVETIVSRKSKMVIPSLLPQKNLGSGTKKRGPDEIDPKQRADSSKRLKSQDKGKAAKAPRSPGALETHCRAEAPVGGQGGSKRAQRLHAEFTEHNSPFSTFLDGSTRRRLTCRRPDSPPDSHRRGLSTLYQKPPSSYEMREPLLKKAVERTKLKVKPHEDEWKKRGCSIMTNAWSDRKRRSIMNLCVNSKIGTIFLSSKESSDISHTSEMIFEYVDQCIEQVGPENVVQVVTDNASNNMGAAKLLRIKRPTIFWTSCAAHTLNLILEGIAKLPRFTKTIEQEKALTIFIYAHHKTLSMMRSYTKRRDIVRPGVTRFASSFLSLQSLMEKKAQLRAMFTSSEWDECKWSKTVKGKESYNTVMSISFWNGVTSFLTIFAPLVKVLRIADADKKPSMGFLYGELMHAKEDIKSVLNNLAKNYDPILEIIDTTMMGRLDTPLHLMAYLLNPYYHYKDPNLVLDQVVSDGVFDCLDVICHDNFDLMDKIINVELPIYKAKGGAFGKPIAAKGWKKEKDVLLASEASKAQEWIIPGLVDEEYEDVNGLEVEDGTSRVRELEEEDFESEEEEQVNENDIDFESDEERVLENYGDGEEEEDPLVLGHIS